MFNLYATWEEKLEGLRILARSAAVNYEFRDKIYLIAKDMGFKNLNLEVEEFLDSLFGERFIYVDDPGIEYYREPNYFIEYMLGDCDDAALLTAAILELLSIPYEFKLVKVNGKIKHIFTQGNVKGKVINFDFTLPGKRFNLGE
jgi:hypothetical protein